MPADRCISFWEDEDGCDYIPPWIDIDIGAAPHAVFLLEMWIKTNVRRHIKFEFYEKIAFAKNRMKQSNSA